jgi:regulator of replication initiation timing
MDRKISKWTCALTALFFAGIAAAQQPSGKADESAKTTAQLEKRLDLVLAQLEGMRHQLDDSQKEIEQLHVELQEMRRQLAESGPAESAQIVSDLRNNVEQLQEQSSILQAEVKQHDQTKVESMSKYPLQVSGMVLLTSFLNNGAVDNSDLPIVAAQKTLDNPHGSLTATARQTILGLNATGPTLWKARSSADFSVDFFGGIPYSDYNTSAGILRLRTVHARLDWPHDSLSVMLDAPVISPLNPTSYLSVGEPALAWSGNLWTWSPQLAWKHTMPVRGNRLGVEFALMDPAAPGPPQNYGVRQPDPGERSRQPAYESRVSWSLPVNDRAIEVGAGGYYSRQSYSYGHHADAWAGAADWKIPFTTRLELSGELYRGRAIGGLGGSVYKDYVAYAEYPHFQGLDAEGGWAQLKFRIMRDLETNFAAGQDNGFAKELRESQFASFSDDYMNLARNRTMLANVIFRPKTYLLFSAEYRNIHSWPITGSANTSQSVGLAAGYLF